MHFLTNRCLAVCLLSLVMLQLPLINHRANATRSGRLDPHDFRAHGKDCRSCHKSVGAKETGGLTRPAGEICTACHRVPGLSHPVDMVPTFPIPADLPLDELGKMTCATCHDPHRPHINPLTGQKTKYLRRDGPTRLLCLACHKK